MSYTETKVMARDGEALFVRHYASEDPCSARTLLIVHGACEHGQRYARVARLLASHGWNVIVPDLRGHGRSGGVHTHVRDFQQYVDDLRAIYDHFACIPHQTAVLGHSMGGLISIRFCQSLPDRVKALVLSSPLLGVKLHLPTSVRVVAKLLGRALAIMTPRLRFHSQLDAAQTTRCPEALAEKRLDSLARTSVTASWYIAMQRAIKGAWRATTRLELPTLVVQAHEDCVVDPQSPERWLEKVASNDKTLRYVPEALHDLFSEPDWDRIATYITRWLEPRMPLAGAVSYEHDTAMSLSATITPATWKRSYASC